MSSLSNTDHCRPIKAANALDRHLNTGLNDPPNGKLVEPFVSKAAPAFLARYSYGEELVRDGRFRPPCLDRPPCGSCRELIKAIESSEATIPLSLVVRGAVEVFVPVSSASTEAAPSRPLRILKPGEFFGVFETLDVVSGLSAEEPRWGVSAGARSVLVLASQLSDRNERKITGDLIRQGVCDRRGIPALIRTIKQDGWEFVRQVVAEDYSTDASRWTCEVLILPGAAQKQLREDRLAAQALLRIHEIGWSQSRHMRDYLSDEEKLVLNDHFASQKRRIVQIDMFGVLRQILAMARGDLPAFNSVTSDAVLPLSKFQEAMGRLPDRRAAVVIAPQHLQAAGDTAFVSVKVNCLPAQRSAEPRSFVAFDRHIEQALHHLPGHYLDLSKTRFLKGEEALEALANPVRIPSADISSRHPFLTGCLKLVRAR